MKRSFWKSLRFAIDGIRFVVAHQRNFRIQLAFGTAVLVLCFFVDFSPVEVLWLVFAVFFVLLGEALNTVIEEMMNVIHPDKNEHVRHVKDASAGMVLISSIFAVSVGAVVLGRHFFGWHPQAGAIVALVFVAFSVILGILGEVKEVVRKKDTRSDSR
ncbi:MAG: hypothetical protein PWP37_696 [Thermotogota bacterium]|nr:hypothetical protein [Thermotogota bacterium]